MKPMTPREQDAMHHACLAVRGAVSTLRLTRITDEDIKVALARLENWLSENDGRWVK